MITLKEMERMDMDTETTEVSKEEKEAFAKKFRNIGLFNNLSDENIWWAVLIFYLVWMQENENERLWKDFKEEIKYKSRFFPEGGLLEKVDNVSDYASVELSKGTILYRAREYTNSDFISNKEVVAFYQKSNELFPHLKLELEDVESESAMNLLSLVFTGESDKIEELRQKVMEIITEEKPFWGFDEKGCDAPPKEFAKAGRANPAGISFLYAATDKKTAIMEMRPQIGQVFNVCKIEICKNIQIFDFTYTTAELKEGEYAKSGDLYVISKEFSYPNYGDVNDYIPTQYLCEYLRKKGFGGIRYKSAVSPEGINVIIFDTNESDKAYKIVESRVYSVGDMDIKFDQIFPLELDGID